MVKAFDAVVTNGTMRGSRRPKDLAGEAVFQLYANVFHHHFFGAGRRPISRAVGTVGSAVLIFHLILDVCGLRRGCARYYAGVTK